MKKVVIIVFLFLLSCIIAFYLRFPSDLCRDITERITNSNTSFDTNVSNCEVAFPFGLRYTDIELRPLSKPGMKPLKIKKLIVRPSLLSLIQGKTGLVLKAHISDGQVAGQINWPHLLSFRGKSWGGIRIHNLRLSSLSSFLAFIGHELEGTLEGNVIWRSPEQANASFRILKGYYRPHLTGAEKLEFAHLEGRMQLNEQILTIDNVNVRGINFHAALKGTININRQEVKKSTISLTLDLLRPPGGHTGMEIKGTLQEPQILPILSRAPAS